MKGGAGAFYMPNLLTNASFETYEQVATSVPYSGWAQLESPSFNPVDDIVLAITQYPVNQTATAVFTSNAGYSLPAGNPNNGKHLWQAEATPVIPGNTIQFSATVNIALGNLPAGVTLIARAFCLYYDSTGAQINPWTFGQVLSTTTVNCVDYEASFVVPVGAASVQCGFYVFLHNTTASPVVLDGSTSVSLANVQSQVVLSTTFDGWGDQRGNQQDEFAPVSMSVLSESGSIAALFTTVPNYPLPSLAHNGHNIVQAPIPVSAGDVLQIAREGKSCVRESSVWSEPVGAAILYFFGH